MSESTKKPVDMSPGAVDRRIRMCSDVSKLCISLQHARFIGKARDLEASRDAEAPEDGATTACAAPPAHKPYR